MRRPRRRPTYYHVRSLRDGTVIGAYPVRKPTPHVLKRDRRRIDEDNICAEFESSGAELRDVDNETRFRPQDIISNALNVRRAIRELVLPRLAELEQKISMICDKLEESQRRHGGYGHDV